MRLFSPTRGLSIRSKLLFVVLALLLIPWMGYEYVRDMKSFLLQGQENALSLTAQAIATVLHDNPELFDPGKGAPEVIGDTDDIFAYSLAKYIRLDGDLSDWGDQRDQATWVDGSVDQLCGPEYEPESLSYSRTVGYRGPYLYAGFEVTDNNVVTRDPRIRRLDNSDHIRFYLKNPGGQIKRYLLTGKEAGRMSVYLVDENWEYALTGEANYDLSAEWLMTDHGYRVEIRIPRFLIGSQARLGFVVADVDSETERQVVKRLTPSSKNLEEDTPLNHLFIHSPEIAKILRGLDRPVTRIWVLDWKQRVRAVVGNLTSKAVAPVTSSKGVFGFVVQAYQSILHEVYNMILETSSREFVDISSDVPRRDEETFRKALSGIPQTQRRQSLDERTEILMAAHPVWSGDRALGVVVVEQSTDEVLSQHKRILENVIAVTLLVLIIITGALLVFASRITIRIRRLRNEAEQAIGPDGRVRDADVKAERNTRDEIGDLSRSMGGMLDRLKQYTRYLEGLPDTLAHELNNPLNVVNSSLDNLQDEVPETRNSKYMARAKNGTTRLASILRNLTEAANLEEALRTESWEEFDLVELASSYIEGYQQSSPKQRFELDIRNSPIHIRGIPDLIAQMLDKLADNALDFSEADSPILVRLDKSNGHAELSILNKGAQLPETMTDRLFDPMVSVGKKNAKQSRLGLGLYVVRLIAEYHDGQAMAYNRNDTTGAKFTVILPLAA
ncbi:MAG: Sensor protein CreC [Gammaproteobacteria bacterium]|nr:Sensor protein CreC [Gammaproteobacteria bacterium]